MELGLGTFWALGWGLPCLPGAGSGLPTSRTCRAQACTCARARVCVRVREHVHTREHACARVCVRVRAPLSTRAERWGWGGESCAPGGGGPFPFRQGLSCAEGGAGPGCPALPEPLLLQSLVGRLPALTGSCLPAAPRGSFRNYK